MLKVLPGDTSTKAGNTLFMWGNFPTGGLLDASEPFSRLVSSFGTTMSAPFCLEARMLCLR